MYKIIINNEFHTRLKFELRIFSVSCLELPGTGRVPVFGPLMITASIGLTDLRSTHQLGVISASEKVTFVMTYHFFMFRKYHDQHVNRI